MNLLNNPAYPINDLTPLDELGGANLSMTMTFS